MKFTDEHRRKISEALKGKTRTAEHSQNISKAKKGQPSPNKGKKCSWAIKNLPKNQKGKTHPRWKGGMIVHGGYVYLRSDLPIPKWNGYVKRANITWYEHTGEIIDKPYHLHHKDGNKLDDSFENLIKVNQSEHKKLEMEFVKRNCDGQFKNNSLKN